MNLLLSFRIIGYINNINCMVTSPVAYSAVSLLQRSTRKPDGAAEHLWVTQPVNVSLKEKENQKLIRMAVVITHQRELGSSYDGCKLLVTHVH